MSTCKVILGTLSGLAIGAMAGILFAPEKGSTTRKHIMDKKDNYVDQLKSKLGEISDSLTKKFESAMQDAEEIVDRGNELYDDVKYDLKNSTSNFKHDIAADIKNAQR